MRLSWKLKMCIVPSGSCFADFGGRRCGYIGQQSRCSLVPAKGRSEKIGAHVAVREQCATQLHGRFHQRPWVWESARQVGGKSISVSLCLPHILFLMLLLFLFLLSIFSRFLTCVCLFVPSLARLLHMMISSYCAGCRTTWVACHVWFRRPWHFDQQGSPCASYEHDHTRCHAERSPVVAQDYVGYVYFLWPQPLACQYAVAWNGIPLCYLP